MFHQIEGIYVDENVSFANLKDLIYKIIHGIFGNNIQLRFRPHTFHLLSPLQKLTFYQMVALGLKFLGGIVNPIVLEIEY